MGDVCNLCNANACLLFNIVLLYAILKMMCFKNTLHAPQFWIAKVDRLHNKRELCAFVTIRKHRLNLGYHKINSVLAH